MLSRIKKTSRQMRPRICSRENMPNIIGGFFLTGANIGLNLVSPYIFGKMVSQLNVDEPLEVGGIKISPLVLAAGIYATAWTLSGVISNLRTWVMTPVGDRTANDLVEDYNNHVMEQSLDYHEETKKGYHDNNIMKCYMATPAISNQLFTNILPTTVEMSIAIGLFSQLYGLEPALILSGIIVGSTIYNIPAQKKATKLQDSLMAKGFQAYYHIGEMTSNYKTIHMFNNLPHARSRLNGVMTEYRDSLINANTIIPKLGIGQNLISGGGLAGLCYWAAQGVLSGRYPVNDLVTMITYFLQSVGPLAQYGMTVSQLLSSLIKIESVIDEMQKQSSIVDAHPNVLLNVSRSNAEIEFKNVSFQYGEGNNKVLDDVSFTIKPGQKVGIVGGSGSGKSTIGKLLFRFCDITKGTILINGQDTKQVGLSSLRSAISIVPQEPTLFNDTLYKNVEYGGLSLANGVTKQQVDDVLKAVCLSDHIASLPDGLETMVGEGGAKLSGGQKQRVAIARALLKDPKILIFDEATSALDNKIKYEVQDNIDHVSKGVTSVVITHHLPSLMDADLIIVLEKGKIVQKGPHAELIKDTNGLYYQLWQEENQHYALENKDENAFSPASSSAAVDFEEEKKALSPRAANSMFQSDFRAEEQKNTNRAADAMSQVALSIQDPEIQDEQNEEKRCGCVMM